MNQSLTFISCVAIHLSRMEVDTVLLSWSVWWQPWGRWWRGYRERTAHSRNPLLLPRPGRMDTLTRQHWKRRTANWRCQFGHRERERERERERDLEVLSDKESTSALVDVSLVHIVISNTHVSTRLPYLPPPHTHTPTPFLSLHACRLS